MQQNTRFIFLTLLLLFVGFASTSIVSYVIANRSLNHHIQTNTLPITSDNVYSEIQRDLLQPILVSSLMAQDTFVRDWVLQGEQYPEQIVRYLDTIQQRYQTVTAFFISEATHNYYHSSGVLKQVSRDDAQDKWYFRVQGLVNDFEVNMDVDTADLSRTTLFVNHKVFDFNHQYLGTIGVGLSSETLRNMIDLYQQRYQRNVFFIDKSGRVVLKGEAYQGADNIQQQPGLREVATRILTSPGGAYSYQSNGQKTFLNTRLVPQLGWYIVVEQRGHQEEGVTDALWINLGVSLVVTLAILILAYFTLGAYQRRLEQKANTDLLTGTVSRYGCEPILENMVRLAKRSQQTFSIVLVDLDHFKQINDNHGHLLGDKTLVILAEILVSHSRDSDTVCRWGGEEFLLLLPDCTVEQAWTLAEKLRTLIQESMQVIDGKRLDVTGSFGVAEFNGHESLDNLFARTDEALYRAKEGGRNKVCPAGQ